MARPTILLTRQDILEHINVAQAVPDIEQAMAAYTRGEDYLPPKAIYDLPMLGPRAGIAACITGYTKATGLLSMKVGQERLNNPQRGLPTTTSWVTLFDVQTGEMLMLCDGTLPTMLRTAAAAAVGAKQLARKDSRVLTVIGAGQLGRQCVRIVSGVRGFEKVYVCDHFEDAARKVVEELKGEVRVPLIAAKPQAACAEADVIVTATNSRAPIVMSDWVRPGTHLSCMGSDLHEKIECEMTLPPRCRLFADEIEHALKRGEVSQAVEKGLLTDKCFVGSLGQVIAGIVPGRQDEKQITMFDGVGIGIQDTTIAATIYRQAVAKNLGTHLAFS